MSTYTSFAILGAGGIGKPITEALVATGASVLVLSRSGSSSKLQIAGTKVAAVDYADIAAVTAVLKEHKVEVIVSTVSVPGLEAQSLVAQAAKAAGVSLFVPSEWGMVTEGHASGILAEKDKFAKYAQSIGLAWTRFYVGFFIGGIPEITGINVNGKVNIAGKGGKPSSFTAEEDIAGFLAHVLTTKPRAELANKSYYLQGDRATLEEIATLFKTEVVYVDAVPGANGTVYTYLQSYLDKGFGSTGYNPTTLSEVPGLAGSGNAAWQGHHFKTIKEVHKL